MGLNVPDDAVSNARDDESFSHPGRLVLDVPDDECFYHLGIGESQPARSDGFTPLTKPPNENLDGW